MANKQPKPTRHISKAQMGSKPSPPQVAPAPGAGAPKADEVVAGGSTSGINVRGVDLGYERCRIISDMDLCIPAHRVTVIIGANGCGKSTLLKGISRILKPEKGTIYLEGTDVHRTPSRTMAHRMAVLPQNPIAPSGLTVEELVAYGRFPHKSGFGNLNAEDYQIIEESIETCTLTGYASTPLEELSGGQRQRAWIAMTICQRTPYLLLDEPTTYLDLAHQLDVLNLLTKLNRREGRTIVMVLHELNNAARVADHMIGMKDGSVVAQGDPRTVLTNANLRTIFQIDARIDHDQTTGKPLLLAYENLEQTEM
ncbi:MAG: ABC transporter ATP-binding protein [Coriobacteriales bacterium]|jgi:iron complex transport system ATP-binding protein|nr:ABC transporter ATP-binding protein [Coriobacteriales bacterium]